EEHERAALAREARFFNAHPYLSGLAVGAALRAEMDGEPPERIAKLREALCGPLGSLGDRLFWASWLPACAAIGVLLVAAGSGFGAVVAFLVLFNVAHLAARIWSLSAGWRWGSRVAAALSGRGIRMISTAAPAFAGLVVGFAVPVAFGWRIAGAPLPAVFGAAGGAVLLAAAAKLASTRASGLTLSLGVLTLVWVVGRVW
ncbi:MAG TPA: PTS system mannose/fructose/sorbose family transporter subunit IID, partial [Nevskiales bacterium]|nr:PTS system mannose/fructose/sorbose family transporter subunit IID [Nevskiales bacterium]